MGRDTSNVAARTSGFSPRRLLRFRLRTLLLLVTAVAAWLGWHLHRTNQQREGVAAVLENGGWVYYDYEFPTGEYRDPAARVTFAVSPWPEWLLNGLGVDFFHDVVGANMVYDGGPRNRKTNPNQTDDVLEHLPKLAELRLLMLEGRQASDEGLAHIGRIRRLEALHLWSPHRISDAGIVHLQRLRHLRVVNICNSRLTDKSLHIFASMPQLRQLSVQQNRITDEGVEALTQLPALEELRICTRDGFKSRITDASVPALSKLRALKLLSILNTEITHDGVKALHEALPGCKVYR